MSLVGNLADLGLGEILQIVSLSRKSGVLTLQSRGRQGVVVFRFGQVIRATSSTIKYFLGEELLKRDVVDQDCINKALQVQQAGAYRERLGTILINRFNVPAQKIEDVVREQIERVVYSFFSWDEGSFEFDLQDNVETIDDSRIDPLQFMLQQGLNPQFLAMEGSRIIDEKRHRGDADDDEHEPLLPEFSDSGEPPAVVEALPVPEPLPDAGADVVVVEDDQAVREFIVARLADSGKTVSAFGKSEEALIAIDTMYRDGLRPAVLVDLIMPRMDGSGLLGGLELLELVSSNFPQLPLLVMSDYRNSDSERRVREIRAEFVQKPRAGELGDGTIADRFAAAILSSLQKAISGELAVPRPEDVNLGDELRLELGDLSGQSSAMVVPSTGIAMLRGMLEELNDPSLGGGVTLLALRFAAEFMGRAIIFRVVGREIVGVGQFGIDQKGQSADRLIRSLKIPVEDDSVFSQVLAERQPLKTMPAPGRWNDYLYEKIGGWPSEVFLGPLVSEGRVVAILYGDNLLERKPLGDTDSLEIFLSQAGVAMEKGLLAQRLKNRAREGS